jgi:hypothetical protein
MYNERVGDVRPITDGEPASWVPVAHLFAEYRASVALIAADATDQIAWLNDQPDSSASDEMMLQLDDAASTVQPRLVRAGLLDQDGIDAVEAILAHLESMTDDALWGDAEALRTRSEWVTARALASHALTRLDQRRDRSDRG